MVRDDVWAAAGGPEWADPLSTDVAASWFLCVGCLESRLGRRLAPRDFTAAPGLELGEAACTARLLDRAYGARP
jgi:hypothetical protein